MNQDSPPRPGWWRSGGQWYPPEQLPQGWSVGPDGVPRSFDYPPMGPVTMGPSAWERWSHTYGTWPLWAKLALPVAALVLAGGTVAIALRDDGDLDLSAGPSTRSPGLSTTTTTRAIPPAPVSVAGLVITPPPTVSATTVSTTRPTTTRLTTIAAPTTGAAPTSTIGIAPSSTIPPTVGATTTTVPTTTTSHTTTTTIPGSTATSTTTSTTRPSTTASTTTTRPATTTTRPTTTASTTTSSTTTTRPATTTTTTRGGPTHTVTGTLLVDDRGAVADGCGGSGRFASFQNGQSIVLTNAAGVVVGQGVLSSCRFTDYRFTGGVLTAKPEFSFRIPGVPEIASYIPRVASTTWPAVSLNTLRNSGWNLDLEVD